MDGIILITELSTRKRKKLLPKPCIFKLIVLLLQLPLHKEFKKSSYSKILAIPKWTPLRWGHMLFHRWEFALVACKCASLTFLNLLESTALARSSCGVMAKALLKQLIFSDEIMFPKNAPYEFAKQFFHCKTSHALNTFFFFFACSTLFINQKIVWRSWYKSEVLVSPIWTPQYIVQPCMQ